MDYFLLGLACVIIIILLIFYIRYSQKQQNAKKKAQKTKNLQNVKCPLCESYLFKGENLISKVYRPMNVPDQLMTVSGCPHCFPKCEPNVKRICPVCHSPVGQTENLTARLFNKRDGKKHVHILGCPHCRKSTNPGR